MFPYIGESHSYQAVCSQPRSTLGYMLLNVLPAPFQHPPIFTLCKYVFVVCCLVVISHAVSICVTPYDFLGYLAVDL